MGGIGHIPLHTTLYLTRSDHACLHAKDERKEMDYEYDFRWNDFFFLSPCFLVFTVAMPFLLMSLCPAVIVSFPGKSRISLLFLYISLSCTLLVTLISRRVTPSEGCMDVCPNRHLSISIEENRPISTLYRHPRINTYNAGLLQLLVDFQYRRLQSPEVLVKVRNKSVTKIYECASLEGLPFRCNTKRGHTEGRPKQKKE